MREIHEPARATPVVETADVCVIGGGTAGVFAAVTAARNGARVVLIEKQNSFGGTAAQGFVCIWHPLLDDRYEKTIIGGLTQETIDRLAKRDALYRRPLDEVVPHRMKNMPYIVLNNEELKIELDELLGEAGVKVRLHTRFCAAYTEGEALRAVIIEDASGRRAVAARVFIDASGNGDVCAQAGNPFESSPGRQPSTTGAKVYGLRQLMPDKFYKTLLAHKDEYGLPNLGFSFAMPGIPDVEILQETTVYLACEVAEELTRAEIEGRRQVRAMMDILRAHDPNGKRIALVDLASHIGIRETRHVHCRYRLTGEDVMSGRTFDDGIANGSYPVDIHFHDRPGAVYRYLDGTEEYDVSGRPREFGRWRAASHADPTYYQIPYRSLVPAATRNLLVCGRAIDADHQAFGAIRVQVSTNQTGEAAGAAAFLSLDLDGEVGRVEADRLRATLAKGGAIIL